MASGNQYSESWTFEECEKFLKEAVNISKKIRLMILLEK